MQSKWPSRAKSTLKYNVFERPKIQKIRPEVLRMQVKRWFCMFGLLCRRSPKKLQNLIQNDLQKLEKRPQDASKTALPKNGNRPWRCSSPILPPESPKTSPKLPKCTPRGPKTPPRSPQEPQRPPKYVPKADQQYYLAASWPRRDARSVYNINNIHNIWYIIYNIVKQHAINKMIYVYIHIL